MVFDPADLEAAQVLVVRAAVIVLMVSIGVRVSPARIAASWRRRRVILLTVLLAIVVVPTIAWLLVHGLRLPGGVAVGILLLAAAPGGSLSLKLVDLADGDVALAVGLFFVLAVAAPFTLPLVASMTIGLASPSIQLAPGPIFVTLVAVQLVPLLLAVLVARLAPDMSARLGVWATHLTTVLLLVVILVSIVATIDEILAVSLAGVLAITTMVVATLAVGLVMGRTEPRTGRAVAFLAGQRSASLALLVAISIGDPATTGAVIAGGLAMLVINPIAAVVLGALRPLDPSGPGPEWQGTSMVNAG